MVAASLTALVVIAGFVVPRITAVAKRLVTVGRNPLGRETPVPEDCVSPPIWVTRLIPAPTGSRSIILLGQLAMDEVLTIAEIEAKFDSEWILIEDPSTDEALEVRSGTVRWHDKDREEVYRRAVEIRPKRFAIVYTGKMPRDTAIAL